MTHHLAGSRSNMFIRLAPCLVLLLGMQTAGCSTWEPNVSWFRGGRPGAAEATAEATKKTVYYTGVAGMKLYSEPYFSASYIVVLPEHQKVYRSKVERGFAYVDVDGSGKTGWVDNSQLVWRLPKTAQSAPPATAPEVVEEAPKVEVQAEPPAPPVEGSIFAPAAAEAQEAPPVKPQAEDSDNVDPSIFSPF